MEFKLEPAYIAGYVGALGSVVFGLNQLRVIIRKHEAKDVSVFDYVVRIVYSALLGIYSVAIGNTLFVLVNFAAALLSAGVAAAALFMKKERGEASS